MPPTTKALNREATTITITLVPSVTFPSPPTPPTPPILVVPEKKYDISFYTFPELEQ